MKKYDENEYCPGYCGEFCLDVRCLIDRAAFYGLDLAIPGSICEDCFYYKGCEDCCFYDESGCLFPDYSDAMEGWD